MFVYTGVIPENLNVKMYAVSMSILRMKIVFLAKQYAQILTSFYWDYICSIGGNVNWHLAIKVVMSP